MISFSALKKRPAVFQSFTGLTLLAFYKLLSAFEQAYEADLLERERRRAAPRRRERGGGRIGALRSLEDKLVFILFYFKFYPIQEVQGFFFGMGQSQAWEWIHRLTPILNRALGYEKQLPARKGRDIRAILESCPGLEFILDGTERPIRRPQDKRRREKYYSGKKKRYTIKNNVVTDKNTGKIKVLSATCEGKKHDKKLADEQGLCFPKGSKLWKDLGLQGYEPEGVTTYQPKKRGRGKELTPEEKERNRQISRERIGVEHSIGGVKVFAIVREVYRNMRAGFEDLIMETACALHNLRLDYPLTA